MAFQLGVRGTMMSWARREYTSPVSNGWLFWADPISAVANSPIRIAVLSGDTFIFYPAVSHKDLSLCKIGDTRFVGDHYYGLSLAIKFL